MASQQLANLQQNAAQQQAIQQQIQQIQLQQQQQQLLQSQAGIQNAQLMAAAQSGIQQVILQPQQMPTVSVTSGVSIQQSMPTQINQQQQGIMTKAGTHQILQMPSSQASGVNVSVPTSMSNAQIVTSIAGTVTADTSNSILGPLSSPQTPLQPPQNPLIAMTTLSASPMSNIAIGTKSEVPTSEPNKTVVSTSVASTAMTPSSSPLKRNSSSISQQEEKSENAKKSNENDVKKLEENRSSTPSKSHPSTPNKSQMLSTATASNSPLTAQNGEIDGKKTNSTPTSTPLLKNELPKAMVKPNVLTHVIEGYVIQESNEPFPVTRQRYSEKENDEPPKKKQAIEVESKSNETTPKVNGEASSSVSSSTPIQSPSDMVACEHCGKQEMRSKLRRKRFCSLTCARASKSSSTEGSPVVSTNNNGDTSITASPSQADKSKTESSDADAPSVEEHIMMKWSVAQVCDFIKNLPGCTDYADDFALQEIDGQALLLLKENHLVSAMGMKLGPALKIVNKIESMRVSKEGDQQGESSSGDVQSSP